MDSGKQFLLNHTDTGTSLETTGDLLEYQEFQKKAEVGYTYVHMHTYAHVCTVAHGPWVYHC